MRHRFYLFLIVFVQLVFASASALSDVDFEALDSRLQKIQKQIYSFKAADLCLPSPSETCTFANFCQDFAGKATQPYLYKNKQGDQMPNYILLSLNAQISRCAGIPEDRISEDPLLYPQDLLENPRFNFKNKRRYTQKLNQGQKIFDETKSRILAILEKKKKSDPENSQQFDKIVERLKSVKIKTPDLSQKNSLNELGCESPNAYYDHNDATVIVCPQMLALPEAGLMSILAHEMAHNFDPCALDMEMTAASGANLKVKTTIPLSENPLKETVKCIASSDAANIKAATLSEIKTDLETDLEYLKMMAADDKQVQKKNAELKNLSKTHEDEMFCGTRNSNRHIKEVFGDWLASKVIAEKLKDLPSGPSRKSFAYDAKSYFYALECPQIAREIVDNLENVNGKTSQELCPQLAYPHIPAIGFDSRRLDSDQHPASRQNHPATEIRINSIYMAEPMIKNSLNCNLQSVTAKDCP